jgi:hypothetical protein
MRHRTTAARPSRSIALLAAMQSGNLARKGNIAVMDRTSTKWQARLEPGHRHNRVLRSKGRRSREQSPKPRQGNRAQDRDQERLRFPRTNLRRAILLRIHSRRDNDTEQMMVQRTTRATLLQ